MLRLAAILLFAAGLAACDAVNTMTDGIKHARAVESDLEASTGAKPNVGFNWHNGRLRVVTVTYPRILETKSVQELAEAVRAAIGKQFKQTPDNIVLGFSLAGQ